MKDIRKALDTIALNNAEGLVSDYVLEKACEAYKTKDEDFLEDYSYDVYVAKSLFDHINGLEPDEEVCKAIVPGQTKVVDGVMYIYTVTPNAKTQYDWRVYNTVSGKKMPDQNKIDAKQKYVNQLFPSDLSSVKEVKTLGGSTGAKLVKDAAGNEYVMKRGSNTSSEHVKSEYLTNQLYNILGVRTPDTELYDNNGEAVLLSKFIPLTRVPNVSDYDEMAKNFVVDALLANWDVYQNDNCLIDSAGRVVRVDNGGSLTFRAQGKVKQFGYDVTDFDSMRKYNRSVVANLTDQDYIDQIDAVLKKKDDVVGFLLASNESVLAKTFEKRFDDLKRIKGDLQAKVARRNKTVKPRKLLDDAKMYRDFTDKELKDFWKKQAGNDYGEKLRLRNLYGWELLGSICKSRGFDARPKVVDDTEYWKLVSTSKYQMFRGVADGSNSAKDYVDDFKYNDNCYYGSQGIHGEGIYFAINDDPNPSKSGKTPQTYQQSTAYSTVAKSYSHNYTTGTYGEIIDCVLDPTAKIALVEDLEKEILSSIKVDKKKGDALISEIEGLYKLKKQRNADLNNLSKKTEDDVKSAMHWDGNTLSTFQNEIDDTDWGAIDDDGHPDYPSFDDFVKGNVFKWVKDNGGKVVEKGKNTDVFTLSLPNSKKTFMISRYQYENNAIKRKNTFAKPYNYPIQRFKDWMMNEHYYLIDKAVKKEIDNLGDKVNNIQSEISNIERSIKDKTDELNDLGKVKNPDADIMSGIYTSVKSGNKEAIGIYAALKGYDVIMQPNGNKSGVTFAVVLNRSKVIVRK